VPPEPQLRSIWGGGGAAGTRPARRRPNEAAPGDVGIAEGVGFGAGVRARMFIHQRCGRLAETLPAMQHDPNRPEDVLKVDADEDGIGGDDAADALRYLVATKALEIKARKLRGL